MLPKLKESSGTLVFEGSMGSAMEAFKQAGFDEIIIPDDEEEDLDDIVVEGEVLADCCCR
jgi:hypothetical protein